MIAASLPAINQQYCALQNYGELLSEARGQSLCLLMRSDAMTIAEFSSVLSKEELQHMRRFRFTHDQQEYAAAHWLKRTAVGAFTDEAPDRLDFSISCYGKPTLRKHKLNFNLSHSSGFVALLLSRFGDVGVDIEFPRPGMDFNSLLPLVAHPKEYERINGSDDFYRLWTLKEAICKATGKGLSLAPQTFELFPWDGRGFMALCDRQRWMALAYPVSKRGYLACAFAARPGDLSIVQLVYSSVALRMQERTI